MIAYDNRVNSKFTIKGFCYQQGSCYARIHKNSRSIKHTPLSYVPVQSQKCQLSKSVMPIHFTVKSCDQLF